MTFRIILILPACFYWSMLLSQPTSGELTGTVYVEGKTAIAGVYISLLHKPSGTKFTTVTNEKGKYYFGGIQPGFGYTIRATHIQVKPVQISAVIIRLGETTEINISFQDAIQELASVLVQSTRPTKLFSENYSPGSILSADQLNRYASGSKNLQDALRVLPEAHIDVGGSGSISIAGESYRYNALYTDGSITHDLFGISPSGTFGGVTGSSPISLEAMELCKVVYSPVDAMQGHYTGAAIQTITRKGSNQSETSAYHYWQNAPLTGNTLTENTLGIHHSNFHNSTSGISTKGAFEKNRVFYFANLEQQEKQIPVWQPPADNTGTNNAETWLPIIRNQLISTYGYDPGDFKEAQEILSAKKMLLRIDAQLNNQSQLTISARYFDATQHKPEKRSDNEIFFSKSGYIVQSKNYTLQFEWRKINGRNRSHQWSGNYTHATDERTAIGAPFPRIKINHEKGSVYLGTDINSGLNFVQQDIATLKKKIQWLRGNQLIRVGTEFTYAQFQTLWVPAAYGYAIYSQPASFILQKSPSYYRIGFQQPVSGNQLNRSATQFSSGDWSVTVSDQIRIHPSFTFWLSGNLQKCWFFQAPPVNEKVNRDVLPVYARLRTLEGARTGQTPVFRWAFAPSMAMRWRIVSKLTLESAIGIQTGRMPMVWPGSVYFSEGSKLLGWEAEGNQLNGLRLNRLRNPLGAGLVRPEYANTIPLTLVAASINLPTQSRFHSQLQYADDRYTFYLSAMITRNLFEPAFTQLNIPLPEKNSAPPGERKVYPVLPGARLQLDSNGKNPYDYAILLHTHQQSEAGGFFWKAGGFFKLNDNWSIEASYSSSKTHTYRDATGSVLNSVWQQTETVNGRNDAALSVSDFSRPNKWVIGIHGDRYSNLQKNRWQFSVLWTAQSNAPYSYVYQGKSMVREDGISGYNELMYIPTQAEIEQMNFVPFFNGIRPISSREQATMLDNWIKSSLYLTKQRGRFAERNGAQLPVSFQCDIKCEWEFLIRFTNQPVKCKVSLECFNVMALINRESGRKWEIPTHQIQGLSFVGYRDESRLEPMYTFDPDQLSISSKQEVSSYNSSRLSRWMIQPGLKIIL
jgi:Carboxypeptidase regulatory-like domain